jgi:hypothetical protein
VSTPVETLIQRSWDVFGLDSRKGRGVNNPFYVPVLVQVTADSLSAEPIEMQSTAVAQRLVDLAANASLAMASICVCVGQYGLGKTELVFQICEQLRKETSCKAIPITLNECRKSVHQVIPGPSHGLEAFAQFLFSPLSGGEGGEFSADAILESIRSGKTILVIDGLDELGLRLPELQDFFQQLLDLVTKGHSGQVRSTVFVTVRREYLAGLGISTSVALFGFDPREAVALRLLFFRLGLFSDSHIEWYLSQRDQEDAFERLRKFPELLSILRRPLFLKVFADLFGDEARIKDLRYLAETPVKLIAAFVEQQTEASQAESIGRFRWDNEKLTDKALRLYRLRRAELSIAEVGELLSTPKGQAPDIDEIWSSIHKCPFLIKTGENSVQFSHKIFIEYFTACALVAGVESESPAEQTFSPFDELVVDVDTRRFVRDMLGRERWIERTYYTYGFGDPSGWHVMKDGRDPKKMFPFLNEIRIQLLDYLTDPDQPNVDHVRRAIRRFFGVEGLHLHPSYLIYNYEAITIFLWYNRSDKRDAKIESHFTTLLKERFDDVRSRLALNDDSHPHWERLVERILSIADRLRIEQITRYRLDKLVECIADPTVKARIQYIQSALSPPVS